MRKISLALLPLLSIKMVAAQYYSQSVDVAQNFIESISPSMNDGLSAIFGYNLSGNEWIGIIAVWVLASTFLGALLKKTKFFGENMAARRTFAIMIPFFVFYSNTFISMASGLPLIIGLILIFLSFGVFSWLLPRSFVSSSERRRNEEGIFRGHSKKQRKRAEFEEKLELLDRRLESNITKLKYHERSVRDAGSDIEKKEAEELNRLIEDSKLERNLHSEIDSLNQLAKKGGATAMLNEFRRKYNAYLERVKKLQEDMQKIIDGFIVEDEHELADVEEENNIIADEVHEEATEVTNTAEELADVKHSVREDEHDLHQRDLPEEDKLKIGAKESEEVAKEGLLKHEESSEERKLRLLKRKRKYAREKKKFLKEKIALEKRLKGSEITDADVNKLRSLRSKIAYKTRQERETDERIESPTGDIKSTSKQLINEEQRETHER